MFSAKTLPIHRENDWSVCETNKIQHIYIYSRSFPYVSKHSNIYIYVHILSEISIYIQICYTRLSLYYPIYIYIYTRIISFFLGSFDFETRAGKPPGSVPRPQSFEERKRPRTTRRWTDAKVSFTSGYRAMGQNPGT